MREPEADRDGDAPSALTAEGDGLEGLTLILTLTPFARRMASLPQSMLAPAALRTGLLPRLEDGGLVGLREPIGLAGCRPSEVLTPAARNPTPAPPPASRLCVGFAGARVPVPDVAAGEMAWNAANRLLLGLRGRLSPVDASLKRSRRGEWRMSIRFERADGPGLSEACSGGTEYKTESGPPPPARERRAPTSMLGCGGSDDRLICLMRGDGRRSGWSAGAKVDKDA